MVYVFTNLQEGQPFNIALVVQKIIFSTKTPTIQGRQFGGLGCLNPQIFPMRSWSETEPTFGPYLKGLLLDILSQACVTAGAWTSILTSPGV